MRNVIKRYVLQEKALIKKAKANSDRLFDGLQAKDALERPGDFAEFLIGRAVNRYVATTLQQAASIGLALSDTLKDMSKKQVKEELKIKKGGK